MSAMADHQRLNETAMELGLIIILAAGPLYAARDVQHFDAAGVLQTWICSCKFSSDAFVRQPQLVALTLSEPTTGSDHANLSLKNLQEKTFSQGDDLFQAGKFVGREFVQRPGERGRQIVVHQALQAANRCSLSCFS